MWRCQFFSGIHATNAVLHDDHNLVRQLIDKKWRAYDVGIERRNTGWPAPFMGTVGYSACDHFAFPAACREMARRS
jgi:hypothetical protein